MVVGFILFPFSIDVLNVSFEGFANATLYGENRRRRLYGIFFSLFFLPTLLYKGYSRVGEKNLFRLRTLCTLWTMEHNTMLCRIHITFKCCPTAPRCLIQSLTRLGLRPLILHIK